MEPQPSPPKPPLRDIKIIERSETLQPPADDKLARLEKDSLFNDKQRGESYRKHIHNIVVCGMYAVGAIMIVLILIRAYHLVAPFNYRWLSTGDNTTLERIIFSGIILSLAGRYFKRYKVLDDQ